MKSSEVDDLGMSNLGAMIDHARERRSKTLASDPRRPTRNRRAVALVSAASLATVAVLLVALNARTDTSDTLVPGTDTEGETTIVGSTLDEGVTPITVAWDLTACTEELGDLISRLPQLRALPVSVFKHLDGDGITWPACEVYLGDSSKSVQVLISTQPISSRGPTGNDDETSERAFNTATLHVDANGSLDLPGSPQALITFDDGLTIFVRANRWPSYFDVRSTVLDLAMTLTADPVVVTTPDATSPVPVTASLVTVAPVPVTASFVTTPAAIVEGALLVDGRCLYFGAEGTRTALLLPAGTRWDNDSATLVFPDATSFRDGDIMRGGGGYLSIENVAREFPVAAMELQQCLPGTSSSESSTVALLASVGAP